LHGRSIVPGRCAIDNDRRWPNGTLETASGYTSSLAVSRFFLRQDSYPAMRRASPSLLCSASRRRSNSSWLVK
jgi:hypothetical protein